MMEGVELAWGVFLIAVAIGGTAIVLALSVVAVVWLARGLAVGRWW